MIKIKNITIEVGRPLKDMLSEAGTYMEGITKGKKIKPKIGLGFSTIEEFRIFFTPKRFEMLSIIRHKNPKSVYELSKLLKRDLKSVKEDMKILKRYNLIETEKVPAKNNTGYKLKPISKFDKINVDISI